jgi:lipopolysaccharide assembly outer membrane protein LptD (OstA)
MKRIVFISCFAALALAQQPGRTDPGDFDTSAMKICTEGNVMHLAGRVVIDMRSFTLDAPEADFDQTSKEIKDRGDVRIRLKQQ